MQKESIIQVNKHGRWFQASVSMMPLEGLINQDGIVTVKKESIPVPELILRKVHELNPMFLL